MGSTTGTQHLTRCGRADVLYAPELGLVGGDAAIAHGAILARLNRRLIRVEPPAQRNLNVVGVRGFQIREVLNDLNLIIRMRFERGLVEK